jgi:hypothetical protein
MTRQDQEQATRADATVKKMRRARFECEVHGLPLAVVSFDNKHETGRCPDKFCGFRLTRER